MMARQFAVRLDKPLLGNPYYIVALLCSNMLLTKVKLALKILDSGQVRGQNILVIYTGNIGIGSGIVSHW